MLANDASNPCITHSELQGIEVTIPGGPPDCEQNDEEPSVITFVMTEPENRSASILRQMT